MKTPIKSTKSGFTLIEIVIVLAIAAVIIGLVFLIVPNAQRSARDTKIQSNSSALSSSIEQFIANNPSATVGSGNLTNLPTGCTSTTSCNGLSVTWATGALTDLSAAKVNNIYINTGAVCGTDGKVTAPTGTPASKYAIAWWSESAVKQKCIGN